MKSGVLSIILTILFTVFSGCNTLAKDENKSILVDNRTRNFNVHIPDSINTNKKMPVVMLFHGGGGSVEGAIEAYKMNQTADKHNFIVVYPAGTGKFKDKLLTWNAGVCCGSAQKENVNDVKFVRELIEYLKKNYNIDSKRIYATGMSNGAGFSYRLACELSDQIAAIAPVGAQIMLDQCNPKRPVSVFHVHGDKDNCANYNGGTCGGCFQEFFGVNKINWPCISVEENFTKFARINGCQGDAKIIKNNNDVICKQITNCKQGSDVTLCTVKEGGHNWPGGNKAAKVCIKNSEGLLCKRWQQITGTLNPRVNTNEMIWEFFKRHSLP